MTPLPPISRSRSATTSWPLFQLPLHRASPSGLFLQSPNPNQPRPPHCCFQPSLQHTSSSTNLDPPPPLLHYRSPPLLLFIPSDLSLIHYDQVDPNSSCWF
ncbi:hypothetical protein CRG98_023226 [Punica granatum]|uniref:Uncharacterized protein n=1 Tax=Punica granatum TaxID=22663 RepID=A0A2I0JJD6_PUNGR|nr:hypothetical protein CRG98_023226 [Punica granatum]